MATSTDNSKGTLAIVGATGSTGLLLVEQALARGYKVIAPVRSPQKLDPLKNDHLRVVQCDLMNPIDLSQHFEGCLAVFSTLGHPGIQISAITFYEDSMKSIVSAMRHAKVSRLVCMTSFYSKYQPDVYPMKFKLIIRPMLGRHLDSMSIMEQYLENECQDLEYTIVRPPRLLDMHIIEKEVKVREDDYFFADETSANQIPRANVARFMLDAFKDGKYLRQGVAIDMPKMLDKSG